jgi:hypothetical protein
MAEAFEMRRRRRSRKKNRVALKDDPYIRMESKSKE